MTNKQKLTRILEQHAEIAERVRQAQLEYSKAKLSLDLQKEGGKKERQHNRDLRTSSPAFLRMRAAEIEATEFWADLEPELSDLLYASIKEAIEKSDQKTIISLQKLKYRLKLGDRLVAKHVRFIWGCL